jgi:peptidoglycan hydrolase-like protein with peptidoglycan-binding domain
LVFTTAAALVALAAAGYAFGNEPAPRARFVSGTPGTSASPTPEGPGRPSATGEDGRPTPLASASASASASAKPPCPKGPYQRQVESYLARLGGYGKVTVDGEQSRKDCRAIKSFQRRYGIYPMTGRPGPVTLAVARRMVRTDLDACDTGSGMTVCLDLTHQTMWLVRGGDVVLGPTVVRTGRAGLTTPSGHFRITEKKPRPISSYYDVPLPYWQRFVGDIGFHQTPSYLHEGPGSHGCVNLLPGDAVTLWRLTSVGTRVHVFGRKPGT